MDKKIDFELLENKIISPLHKAKIYLTEGKKAEAKDILDSVEQEMDKYMKDEAERCYWKLKTLKNMFDVEQENIETVYRLAYAKTMLQPIAEYIKEDTEEAISEIKDELNETPYLQTENLDMSLEAYKQNIATALDIETAKTINEIHKIMLRLGFSNRKWNR